MRPLSLTMTSTETVKVEVIIMAEIHKVDIVSPKVWRILQPCIRLCRARLTYKRHYPSVHPAVLYTPVPFANNRLQD